MKKITKGWTLFLEAAKKEIADLKFGELKKPSFVKLFKDKIKLIDISPEEIPEHPFPENDSEETKKEIEYTIRKMKEDSLSKEQLARLDKRAVNYFFDFMDSKKISYDEGFLRDLSDDISRFAVKLKMKYQRPRPVQLAPLLGYELKDVPTSSDDSPAYPSGHTLLAWTIALYLSEKHPEYKQDFYEIARKIEFSRIVRGAHFLSDNVFSKLLARKYIVPNIKE